MHSTDLLNDVYGCALALLCPDRGPHLLMKCSAPCALYAMIRPQHLLHRLASVGSRGDWVRQLVDRKCVKAVGMPRRKGDVTGRMVVLVNRRSCQLTTVEPSHLANNKSVCSLGLPRSS